MLDWMDWGNCTFVLQIFIAETIFLYGFPRRKHFKLIYFIGVPVITLLSVFFPMPDYLYTNQFYLFFRFSFLFMVTLGLMALCFKAKAIPTISACASGYALQHLTYHVTALICLTPLLENYQNEVLSQMRLLEIIVFPIVYLLGYLTFGRLAAKHEFYKNYNSYFVLCSVLTLFVCLIISRFARLSSSDDITTIAISVYAITCCLLSLLLNYSINFVSIEKAKAETLERIEYERKNQYEFSKQNSEYLRVQIHDLKHVMSLVDSDKKEELASISKTLEEYDSQIQTGNDDLDLIINEKKSTCRDNNISFTFFGNGKALSFVSKYDIYILFGNILDNAIEAVLKSEDETKRVISLTIETQGNYVIVSSMNYYTEDVQFIDGLPKTTKNTESELHGYGTKSIQLIAEKYSGNASFNLNENVFNYTILLLNLESEKEESDTVGFTEA